MRFLFALLLALATTAAVAQTYVLREKATGCPTGEDARRAEDLLREGKDATGQPRAEARTAWLAYTLAYGCVTFEKGERVVVDRAKRQSVTGKMQAVCMRREAAPDCSYVTDKDLDSRLEPPGATKPGQRNASGGSRDNGFRIDISP
jgi:hypothetical protein